MSTHGRVVGQRAWRFRELRGLVACIGLALTSCGGKSEDGPKAPPGSSGGFDSGGSSSQGGRAASGGRASSGAPGSGAAGGSAGLGTTTGGTGGLGCSEPTAPSVPLRRLSAFEYDNSLSQIFGIETRPAATLFAQLQLSLGNEEAASTAHVEAFHKLAHDVALELSADPERLSDLLGCDAALPDDSECREQLMAGLLPQIFRGPIRDEVRDEMDAAFMKGEALDSGFPGGARAVLEVALQSPEFLYRVEFGEPAPELGPAMGRPSQHEMAVRLSYFLRGAPADSALWEAAERAELTTKEQIAAQARRLLKESNAHDVVRRFYLAQLGLPVSDLAARATVGPDLADWMARETAAFVDDVTFEGAGDLKALFTAPFTWVNGPLAKHYGIAGVTGDAFQRVALDPNQHAGLLTRGAFLASGSINGMSDPSWRGWWVRQNLLCTTVPPHPPGAIASVGPAAGLTTRQRFEQTTSPASVCVACHRYIDPIGFAFEHFDAVGRFREVEAGLPIDASGELVGTDADGTFDGAVELSSRLANSVDVRNCYADNWLRFAYGRPDLEGDGCSRDALHAAFAAAEGNIVELLVAVTQTDGFLYRPRSEVSP